MNMKAFHLAILGILLPVIALAQTPGRPTHQVQLGAGTFSYGTPLSGYTEVGLLSMRLSYGLGLLIVEDRSLSPRRLLGHQGFAYGCADGAFLEEGTGRQIVFLNGGCSEARRGRLGLCNRDVLAFGLKQLR